MKIAIDAGHGGKDPGAVGPSGLAESVVVLEISRVLAGLLEKVGISTFLTRAEEVFVELGVRCERANNWGADYFVSIHCNSNGPDAHGIETLYKSEKGKELAAKVQRALLSVTAERDRGLKHRSDLYVLNGTRMPAILPEIGFISNPETELRLKESSYRELIAMAIYHGILKHLHWNMEGPL